MQFYSLSFIFAFLPASAILYRLMPKKYGYAVIFFISAVFYALCQPEYFALFLAAAVSEFVISEILRKTENRERQHKIIFILSITANAAVMLAMSVRNQIEGAEIPLGTMVVCFTSIGYFTDIHRSKSGYIKDFWEFSVFTCFFGKLYRGPLMRIDDFNRSKLGGKGAFERTGDGIYLFVRGCAKYVILAEPLKQMNREIIASNFSEMSVAGAWLSVITSCMYIFYDLSSFCDMARGTGLIFDMKLPQNFYFPFQSPSVTDFMDRFNMTVTGFFRHYVYDTLRTRKESFLQFSVDTFLICMLCGIWFGVMINNVLWGVYIAFFIILEKLFLGKILERIPKLFARFYTFCITIFSMSLLSTLSQGLMDTLSAMFSIGEVPAVTSEISYILSENILVMVLGAFFLTSIYSRLVIYLRQKHATAYGVLAFCETAVLLVFVTGSLIQNG